VSYIAITFTRHTCVYT